MSRTSVRRAVATTASLTLIAAGVTVGMGAGIASAAPTCEQSSSAFKKDASTWGATHSYSKSLPEKEAAAGTEVTYKSVVGTEGGLPLVYSITDYPPANFGAPVSAKVTALHAIGGVKSEIVDFTPNGTGFKVANALGWSVNSGNPAILEMTYLVPEGAALGDQITSGGMGATGTIGIDNTLPDVNSCFTVRGKNAGESVSGSLDGAGLGSSDGNMSSTGSLSDFIGDVISRIFSNGS
ncbi:hypothetical protein B2J88_12485 [Rhodococcus sp. SRB_17]|nr:hypothetical protein [Rhodococcus sp. SRB_17]